MTYLYVPCPTAEHHAKKLRQFRQSLAKPAVVINTDTESFTMTTKKLKPVIARKYLPSRNPMLSLALLYGLYSKVYALPLWADFIAGFVILCALIYAVSEVTLEVEVHPKDLS
jgi:hypothetical protein